MQKVKYLTFEQEGFEQIVKYSIDFKNYSNNFIVEIGSSNNSYYLNDELNRFQGILVDGSLEKIMSYKSKFPFLPVCKYITSQNVCDILKEHNVPKDFYMLNLDIDGPDFFVLMAILKEYRPKIIVSEYNEKIPYPVKYAIKNDPNYKWGWNHNYGYSAAAVEDILTNFNYSIDNLIVNNIFLIRNDNGEKPNIEKIPELYKSGYLDRKEWLNNGENGTLQPWNKDIDHIHNCKTKEEVEEVWRKYFLENKNSNTGNSMSDEINNYVMNDEYEKHLTEFLNN